MGGEAPQERKCQGCPVCQEALPAPAPCCSSHCQLLGASGYPLERSFSRAFSGTTQAGGGVEGAGMQAGRSPLQTQTGLESRELPSRQNLSPSGSCALLGRRVYLMLLHLPSGLCKTLGRHCAQGEMLAGPELYPWASFLQIAAPRLASCKLPCVRQRRSPAVWLCVVHLGAAILLQLSGAATMGGCPGHRSP